MKCSYSITRNDNSSRFVAVPSGSVHSLVVQVSCSVGLTWSSVVLAWSRVVQGRCVPSSTIHLSYWGI